MQPSKKQKFRVIKDDEEDIQSSQVSVIYKPSELSKSVPKQEEEENMDVTPQKSKVLSKPASQKKKSKKSKQESDNAHPRDEIEASTPDTEKTIIAVHSMRSLRSVCVFCEFALILVDSTCTSARRTIQSLFKTTIEPVHIDKRTNLKIKVDKHLYSKVSDGQELELEQGAEFELLIYR